MPLPDALTAALQRIAARDAERIATLEHDLATCQKERDAWRAQAESGVSLREAKLTHERDAARVALADLLPDVDWCIEHIDQRLRPQIEARIERARAALAATEERSKP